MCVVCCASEQWVGELSSVIQSGRSDGIFWKSRTRRISVYSAHNTNIKCKFSRHDMHTLVNCFFFVWKFHRISTRVVVFCFIYSPYFLCTFMSGVRNATFPRYIHSLAQCGPVIALTERPSPLPFILLHFMKYDTSKTLQKNIFF